MSKPKVKPNPGVYIMSLEVDEAETCQFSTGDWGDKCGTPAILAVRFSRGDELFKFPVCRACLARMARSFVTYLE